MSRPPASQRVWMPVTGFLLLPFLVPAALGTLDRQGDHVRSRRALPVGPPPGLVAAGPDAGTAPGLEARDAQEPRGLAGPAAPTAEAAAPRRELEVALSTAGSSSAEPRTGVPALPPDSRAALPGPGAVTAGL